jgi:hypothetical protein
MMLCQAAGHHEACTCNLIYFRPYMSQYECDGRRVRVATYHTFVETEVGEEERERER